MLPRLACESAGRAAEHVESLPANMLASIGLVESGRVDPVTGQVASWPWTVNVDGVGHYFQGERDAAAFVRLAAAAGAKDIDVGCFQISLEHHPDAFSSLDAAFDPIANADFAARFLDQLKVKSGSWNAAIADYHSAFPELGVPYRQLVLDAWRRIGDVQPGLGTLSFEAVDPVVILEGPAARLVRVITLDGDAEAPAIGGLPVVITP
jgi:soluble lytic murein transglycosylase-like protein